MSAHSDPVPPPQDDSGSHAHHDHEEMVCYCFHVPLHKIENFVRRERPTKISMISHCLGAGTGCGTCVWDIKDIYKRVMAECAAEDAKKGLAAPTPGATPPPPPAGVVPLAMPFAPLTKVTGRQPVQSPPAPRLHSPSVDLGPVFAPIPLLTPPVVPTPATAPILTNAEPDLEPELEIEPDEDASMPPLPLRPPQQQPPPPGANNARPEDTP